MTKLERWRGIIAYLIFLQAFVAMIGSLYYSAYGDPVQNLLMRNFFPVDNGLLPCDLCWYARIIMYPMVLISFVGMLKGDRRFTDYILPLAILGIILEAYQYGLQKFYFGSVVGCSLNSPCSVIEVEYFGFITISLMALVAFLFIAVLCVANIWLDKREPTLP